MLQLPEARAATQAGSLGYGGRCSGRARATTDNLLSTRNLESQLGCEQLRSDESESVSAAVISRSRAVVLFHRVSPRKTGHEIRQPPRAVRAAPCRASPAPATRVPPAGWL